ncbi:MAG: histidinol dehydrogenase [Gemmatimonadaceae bacterium]|nr:histidinol dehydrogenase [Gemmatimonadaceae bacterium]
MTVPTVTVGSQIALRHTGALDDLSGDARRALLRRGSDTLDSIARDTTRIIADVRARGDAALLAMAREFDGADLSTLVVPRPALARALQSLSPTLRRAMERSARNIETVHRAFLPAAIEVESEPGILIGRRPDPLRRVGVYAPGGRASYPSSVLMSAIPARVAGVGEVIVASPPDASGSPPAAVLAAAALCGVERVFAIGGAGAIAAMALGTRSVPRVDRIVGPGNAYVAAAKLQLVGEVGIDMPAGPSELLIIADESADPAFIAREMVAQAEHDPLACVVALTIGAPTAAAVERELRDRVPGERRRDIITRALAGQSGVLCASDIDAAIEFANEYAPEHLLLAVGAPDAVLPRVRNAGTVLVGPCASVTFGDYMVGANHVLPTAGTARFYSGLSPLDFVRWTTYQRITPAAARSLAADVADFADAERLFAHAAAARAWAPS